MTKKIFKYPLQVVDEQWQEFPAGAEFRALGCDPFGILCLWMEVDTSVTASERWQIHIRGTGHPVPTAGGIKYRGHIVQDVFVWHLWF